MDINELRKNSGVFNFFNGLIFYVIALIVYKSWVDTEMDLTVFYDNWEYMLEYIGGNPDILGSGYFPPVFDDADLHDYFFAMVETVQMAILALILSVIIALPFSLISSRNILLLIIPGSSYFHVVLRNALYSTSTLIANIFRSVNELVWALIFVSAIGLGPMAGIIALGIHTGGVLSKLLAEGNEAIDPGPVTALTNSGAGTLKVILYGVLPQTMPHFISMVLYRFESDVRSASILGFVGAGGIGFYLYDKLRSFENGSVATILLFIIVTVWVLDYLSSIIRKRFI